MCAVKARREGEGLNLPPPFFLFFVVCTEDELLGFWTNYDQVRGHDSGCGAWVVLCSWNGGVHQASPFSWRCALERLVVQMVEPFLV